MLEGDLGAGSRVAEADQSMSRLRTQRDQIITAETGARGRFKTYEPGLHLGLKVKEEELVLQTQEGSSSFL